MDEKTLAAYDRDATVFAGDWESQPVDGDLHALLRQYFRPGKTADIGCGSGRDTAWLAANGFDATGFDASEGLLTEARRLHPGVAFQYAVLPALDGVSDGSFANVFCETVIMHLPAADIAPSVRRLMAMLQPGGTLYLSWCITPGTDKRDDHGRLYAAFEAGDIRAALGAADILLDVELDSGSSGKRVHRLVARKRA